MDWYVYILECSDGSFYTGVTNNLVRRLDQHNHSNSVSSKYTRVRRPVRLVYKRKMGTRSDAMKCEREIKRLSRESKRALVNGSVAQW